MIYKYSRYRFAAPKLRGFTLVEVIIVLIVLAIAAVTIATLTGNIFNAESNNKNLEVGTQLMQACAEQVLATRRNGPSGFASMPDCSALPLPSGFTDLLASSQSDYIGAGCPSGASCRLVTISVTTGSGALKPVTLLLVGP